MRALASRLARLEQIEQSTSGHRRIVIQFGRMKELPASYTGERHVVTVSCAPDENGRDFYQWEERLGPAPAGDAESHENIHLIRVCFVSSKHGDDAK